MSSLQNKIDFVALVSVTRANSNGDPLNGNRPRTDLNGFGEISDVCIKRKIRNRMQDLGKPIFVQSEDRCSDGCGSLSDGLRRYEGHQGSGGICPARLRNVAGRAYLRASLCLQGCQGLLLRCARPRLYPQASSLSPVEIESLQITKSVNGEKKEKGENRASDTMGMKHFVRFGLYEIKGSINVQLAEKTGFSEDDADTVKECLRTLFVNDASSARPDGSMEVVKLFWWRHSCKDGQYSSARVHRSVKVALRDAGTIPTSADDYVISLETLPGLEPEVIDGI